MYLPRKEIEIGLKTPGTSVNIVSIEHKEAVGRRWPSNLDEIQHIMKLPMNITYKHRFAWRVYWYFHTIRLPMKNLTTPKKQLRECATSSNICSQSHHATSNALLQGCSFSFRLKKLDKNPCSSRIFDLTRKAKITYQAPELLQIVTLIAQSRGNRDLRLLFHSKITEPTILKKWRQIIPIL